MKLLLSFLPFLILSLSFGSARKISNKTAASKDDFTESQASSSIEDSDRSNALDSSKNSISVEEDSKEGKGSSLETTDPSSSSENEDSTEKSNENSSKDEDLNKDSNSTESLESKESKTSKEEAATTDSSNSGEDSDSTEDSSNTQNDEPSEDETSKPANDTNSKEKSVEKLTFQNNVAFGLALAKPVNETTLKITFKGKLKQSAKGISFNVIREAYAIFQFGTVRENGQNKFQCIWMGENANEVKNVRTTYDIMDGEFEVSLKFQEGSIKAFNSGYDFCLASVDYGNVQVVQVWENFIDTVVITSVKLMKGKEAEDMPRPEVDVDEDQFIAEIRG